MSKKAYNEINCINLWGIKLNYPKQHKISVNDECIKRTPTPNAEKSEVILFQ